MTIQKGENWGDDVSRPSNLRVVAGDAEFVEEISRAPGDPVGLRGGDLFRTLGARPIGDRQELRALPVDLVHVSLDDSVTTTAVAHVIARRPWWKGGWLLGSVLAVMNAEYLGQFDIAPRGHPNDGRVETLAIDDAMTIRQRLAVRRRLKNATHLPHPHISTRSVRANEWSFDRALVVEVDGVRVGRTTQLAITVEADAAVVYA